VTALATATTNNKQVMNLLQRLPKIYLQPLVGFINRIEPHPDFAYMVDTLQRKKSAVSPLQKAIRLPYPAPTARLPLIAGKSRTTLHWQMILLSGEDFLRLTQIAEISWLDPISFLCKSKRREC
jgi:hypothetical protein